MRLRRPHDEQGEEVPITPLIDCVFLLIIFFLVTSMFKRFEMLIPIEMPDPTSALARQANDSAVRLAIDEGGNVFTTTTTTQKEDIQLLYTSVPDFAVYLKSLQASQGREAPLQFAVDPETPAQKVIDVLDIAQLQGFTNVSVRTLPHHRL